METVKCYYSSRNEYGGISWNCRDVVITGFTKKGNYKVSDKVYDIKTGKCLNFQAKAYVPEQFQRGFIVIKK